MRLAKPLGDKKIKTYDINKGDLLILQDNSGQLLTTLVIDSYGCDLMLATIEGRIIKDASEPVILDSEIHIGQILSNGSCDSYIVIEYKSGDKVKVSFED